MKRVRAIACVLGLCSAPALAERIVLAPSQIHATPLTGAVVGTPTFVRNIEAFAVDFSNVPALPPLPETVVYSNNPLLGTSTIPSPTIGGIPNSFVGADWNTLGAAWADHVVMTQSAVITTITYLYSNRVGVSTQSIILGTGPAFPTSSGPFTGIGTLATIVAPALPQGDVVWLSITGLSVPITTPFLYIGYEDAFGAGPGTLSTFWVSGGFPLIGNSTDAVVFWYPATATLNSAVFGPLVLDGTNGPIAHANIVQSIITPEPVTIVLMAAGGLAVLRRRRGE